MSGPKALEPDSYDRFTCAVCMELSQPLLNPNPSPVEENSAEAQRVAGMAAKRAAKRAAENDTRIVECSGCGVRVHRECYGVPEGVGGLGSGERRVVV